MSTCARQARCGTLNPAERMIRNYVFLCFIQQVVQYIISVIGLKGADLMRETEERHSGGMLMDADLKSML